MERKGHRTTSQKAFDLWHQTSGTTPIAAYSDKIIEMSSATDHLKDMELIDVEGGIYDNGRDNPHSDDLFEFSDHYHYESYGRNFTAFNHFIDIRKGRGLFDDYDGYSYEKGSAHLGEHQPVSQLASHFEWLAELATDKMVDEGINYWLNDEYVHAPPHPWYNHCSPAVERYSFYEDHGSYLNALTEAEARFPLAESIGRINMGIPYTVFFPVDNLGRYWYSHFVQSPNRWDRSPLCMGQVLHAIQDASIPHHAAGCLGNWHCEYEQDLDDHIEGWMNNTSFGNAVLTLVTAWDRQDNNAPNQLAQGDWTRIPAINWRVDFLITWIALNAYREYVNTHHNFAQGYTFNETSMRNLTIQATAMSLLVLQKANRESNIHLVGNTRSGELHVSFCEWVGRMNPRNMRIMDTIEEWLGANLSECSAFGPNGCHWCLPRYDRG